MDTEKISKNYLQSVVNYKLYARYNEFLNESPENKVMITLEPEGIMIIEKHSAGKVISKTSHTYYSWIHEEETNVL